MPVDLARVEEIFAEALRQADAAARTDYLQDACGGDTQLRQRVERLLAAHDATNNFIKLPGADPASDESVPLSEGPGTVIGPYKLLQQIGEGGMGVVFMAEQTEPLNRTVALKIIKPGMDTRQVIARFEAERQALALMDHPNIAKVLDAGTTSGEPGGVSPGRPYFVMELVKGVPITKYCDEKHLPLRARLELFMQVCQAVQHAHQKGIIHRDIKPNNVLVAEYDNQAVPKVIDFGVAKATAQKLTERTMFTEFGQVLGTMEYMSPEQARFNQLDVDTRSDIYSLGVLLYEILAGSTPFGRKRLNEAAFDEMLRIIREEEPPKPSTRLSTTDQLPSIAANRSLEPLKLNRLLQGELDWIVMKALEKDRNRRYETASGFAADIQRHLHDEPIHACPPSAGYRFRKFARRNKVAILITSAVIVTLLLSVVGLAVSNRLIATERNEKADALREKVAALEQAETQRQRAEDNLLKARVAVRGILTETAFGRGEWSKIPPDLRKRFADAAVNFYHSLLQDDSTEPTARYETAVGYRSLSSLHNSWGEYQRGENLVRQSIAILEPLVAQYPNVVDYRQQLAYSHFVLGSNLYAGAKQPADAQAELKKAILLYEQLLSESPESDDYFQEIARCYDKLIGQQRKEGALQELEQTVQQLLQLLRDMVRLKPDDALAWNGLAWYLATEPDAQWHDPDRAVELASKAVELVPLEGAVRNTLGVAQYRAGHYEPAIDSLNKSMELRQGGDAFDWIFLAMAHWQLGNKEEAHKWYAQAVEWMEKNNPGNDELRRFRAEATELLGIAEPQSPTDPPDANEQLPNTNNSTPVSAPNPKP